MADTIAARAKDFAKHWQGRGTSERGEAQTFWVTLLSRVFGIEYVEDYIQFEVSDISERDTTAFLDAYIPAAKVLIEQKRLDVKLDAPITQADGTKLTPYQQARRCVASLPLSQHPRCVVTCNFAEFRVYDMETPNAEPEVIRLKDLGKEYYRLQFLVNTDKSHITREMDLSFKAGRIIGEIYEAMLKQFGEDIDQDTLSSLNILCVRLVFCMYAEDTELFERLQFRDYLRQYRSTARGALKKLFKMLDTPYAERDKYEDEALLAFPCVNGGLFKDEVIIPRLTDGIVGLIIKGSDFDWSEISPTIFGALFESTLNPVTRRCGGMHYTSIENIHKAIDPLFLEALRGEVQDLRSLILNSPSNVKKLSKPEERRRLEALHNKLGSLKFLDPACGSGNFLTETYLCLRRLENEVISLLHGAGQAFLEGEDFWQNLIQVRIDNFYGIEINYFAVTVAKTALWIAENQMLRETQNIIGKDMQMLPIRSQAHIVEGNALRLDWGELVPPQELSYIIGNPPFAGARLMLSENAGQALQKKDIHDTFKGWPYPLGNLDYVACWFKKASDYMRGTSIRTALVATNSITQGIAVQPLWQQLFADGLQFDFAHRTFCWDSEADSKDMAHVHCVIIGCSHCGKDDKGDKVIFSNGLPLKVKHISAYLRGEADCWLPDREAPICAVPVPQTGNQPIDGGYYLFKEEEMREFIEREPQAAKWFRPWYGAAELLHNQPRYCLWLKNCPPHELRTMPLCLERVEKVRAFRLRSSRKTTVKLAGDPLRFQIENFPASDSLAIPETSSARRRYIPMGYLKPDALCSNAIRVVPEADPYMFGVLNSNVHMAWMRAVAGRLKSDYRYSIGIVYNNFPWPEPTEAQRAKIERAAREILEVRKRYPQSSLADLYDEIAMPYDLRQAHRANDAAVMRAYGFEVSLSESECVKRLLERYKKLAE